MNELQWQGKIYLNWYFFWKIWFDNLGYKLIRIGRMHEIRMLKINVNSFWYFLYLHLYIVPSSANMSALSDQVPSVELYTWCLPRFSHVVCSFMYLALVALTRLLLFIIWNYIFLKILNEVQVPINNRN